MIKQNFFKSALVDFFLLQSYNEIILIKKGGKYARLIFFMASCA